MTQSVSTITVLLRKAGHKTVKAPTQSDAMQYPNNKHYLCEVCGLWFTESSQCHFKRSNTIFSGNTVAILSVHTVSCCVCVCSMCLE